MKKEISNRKTTRNRLKKACSFVCVMLMLITGNATGVILTNPAFAEETNEASQEAVNAAPQETTEQAQGNQPAIELTAKAAVLMEASTGTIIYENNADQQLCPASITKIMTLILIFDALKEGKISLDDMVTTSEHAASMGGSQVFLEAQEQQNVDTMIKCIAVASANDACVAMAEYIAGTEEEFVKAMNDRAAGLGMSQTHFVNCCGLDTDGHITSARDVALMSRELITKHPEIFNYTSIWMENITHTTAKGTSEFGLTNTNKLMKQYPYATGLKTGSTSQAKYCVSATASKDGVDLIAVIMAAADYKVRFKDATTLLNYGFANCHLYKDEEMPKLEAQKVEGSFQDSLNVEYEQEFSYLSMEGGNFENIEKKLEYNQIKAPVKKGQCVGKLTYSLNGKEIGSVNVTASETIKEAGFGEYCKMILQELLL